MEKDEYSKMYDLETRYWWFLGKQFLVKKQIDRLPLQASEDVRLLDIGAGTGIIMKVLQKFGKVYGVELSLEAIKFLERRNLHFIVRSDANNTLPFRNDTFSVITCLDVLEHLDKDVDLVHEMFRVCRPGGYVILTVPAFQAFWSSHDRALHHRRRYTRVQVQTIVKQTDFRVLKLSYYNVMMSIPIMVIRKIKSLCMVQRESHSDLSIKIPCFLNRALTYFYRAEISLLSVLSYPFGVSIVAAVQKPGQEG